MRVRKTLSNWLTTRYLLVIRNEENLAEKSTLSFTYAKVIVFFFTLFLIIFLISLYLVNTALSQWYNPRHAQLEMDRRLYNLSEQIDELKGDVERKDQFIQSIQHLVKGEWIEDHNTKEVDGELVVESKSKKLDDYTILQVDSQFRKEIEASEEGFLNYASPSTIELQEIFLFTPISGIVSSEFNVRGGHYGVDVVSRKNEPVKSVASGSVIFASWTRDFGNVVAIQHKSSLISVYKHNSEIITKVGNFVNAGDIISIIGNSGELSTGPHLHFELWYNGSPVNPEEFVSF